MRCEMKNPATEASGQFGEWVAPQHDGSDTPISGHDVLFFPMNQKGHFQT